LIRFTVILKTWSPASKIANDQEFRRDLLLTLRLLLLEADAANAALDQAVTRLTLVSPPLPIPR